MTYDQERNDQIAHSLAGNYENVYYVSLETGEFTAFANNPAPGGVNYPTSGSDFFGNAIRNADSFIHPDDIELVKRSYGMDVLRQNLDKTGRCTVSFRTLIKGVTEHMRCIMIMCDDGKHIVCCLDNIEKEIRKNEQKERELQSAKRMARLDELTGVRNSNAFREYAFEMDGKIKAGDKDQRFALVMCDLNDLKRINDTRGHSFGDEAIQRTSRLICDVYEHSPVFRVGGDEFVVILTDRDYEHRDELLAKIRAEALANKRSRSGPVVASGMAVYDPESDRDFDTVYERADDQMYENKSNIKTMSIIEGFANMDKLDKIIPDERKRLLDGMFGALVTVAGGGYIYLNDMKYDFSRWALPLVDDFGLASEYMYHADRIWLDYIHPDDKDSYREAVDAVLKGDAVLRRMCYRARRADGNYMLLTTRGFVLSDREGLPEYFGGIIIPQ